MILKNIIDKLCLPIKISSESYTFCFYKALDPNVYYGLLDYWILYIFCYTLKGTINKFTM